MENDQRLSHLRVKDWHDRGSKNLGLQSGRLLFGLACLVASGCQDFIPSDLSTGKTTPIKTLETFPDRRNLKPVLLSGRVVRHAPFLKGGAYLLEDRTGQIWVATERGLPPTGDEIVLQGGPEYRQIAIGSRNLKKDVYVQELERRSR